MTKDKKFNAWLYWLKRAGFFQKLWKEDVVLCPKSWRVYFDAGFNIFAAIKEDLSNA